MSRVERRERGSAILEFLLVGIPLTSLIIIILEVCLSMWSYHTLANAIEDGAVYASTKGQDYILYTGSGISISTIVQDVLSAGVGIDPGQLNITFHSSASAYYSDITCNPASTCLSGAYTTTVWPPAKVSSGPPAVYGNLPAISYFDITGTYPSPAPIINLVLPSRILPTIGTLQFSATSRQVVQF